MKVTENNMKSNHTNIRVGFRMLAALTATVSLAGCNYIVLLGYLIGGPPSIEPDFDATTRKSMTDKDVIVAVVCYVPDEVKWNYPEIDQDLAKYISYRMHQHRVKTIDPDRVNAWLDENSEWSEPDEIGHALSVKYVIYVDLQNFVLFEENSSDLFRGRADGAVSVWEMDEDGEGDKIYHKEIISKFPLLAPVSTYEVSEPMFKRRYLSRLSEEIGRLFYEHYAGDDVPDAT